MWIHFTIFSTESVTFATFFTKVLPFSLKRSWPPTDHQLSTSGWALMALILVKVRRVRSS